MFFCNIEYENSREIEIKDVEGISDAMEITDQISGDLNFDPKQQIFLRLATEEACMNAHEYCVLKGKSSFKVIWKIKKDVLNIDVLHKGEIFRLDINNEVNTTTRGRGLHIIQNIMDHVFVKQFGEEVCLSMFKYKV